MPTALPAAVPAAQEHEILRGQTVAAGRAGRSSYAVQKAVSVAITYGALGAGDKLKLHEGMGNMLTTGGGNTAAQSTAGQITTGALVQQGLQEGTEKVATEVGATPQLGCTKTLAKRTRRPAQVRSARTMFLHAKTPELAAQFALLEQKNH